MTKEEVLNSHLIYGGDTYLSCKEDVLKAMDEWADIKVGEFISNQSSITTTYEVPKKILEEYARIRSIEFFKWNAEKIFEYVDWLKNKRQFEEEPSDEYSKMCEINSFDLSSIDKRYELFSQQSLK